MGPPGRWRLKGGGVGAGQASGGDRGDSSEALQHKTNILALFPTDLPMTRHTRVLAAKVGPERGRPVKGIAEVLASLSSINTNL